MTSSFLEGKQIKRNQNAINYRAEAALKVGFKV